MISDEMMVRRDAGELIDGAVAAMVSAEMIQRRAEQLVGCSQPLLCGRGVGRILDVDEAGISVLVRGVRVELTWDRLLSAWRRLRLNHTLTVDELGGRHDAIALVSLLTWMQIDDLDVTDLEGVVRLRKPLGVPVHQYADITNAGLGRPQRHSISGG